MGWIYVIRLASDYPSAFHEEFDPTWSRATASRPWSYYCLLVELAWDSAQAAAKERSQRKTWLIEELSFFKIAEARGRSS